MNRPLPFVIRPMEPSDVATVTAIDQQSFPTPWQASSYLHELKQFNRSFYYTLLKPMTNETVSSKQRWMYRLRNALNLSRESRIIGYVGFRFRLTEAHISTIAIHPDWRGQGLGELLLLTALEKALLQGANVVSLEVRPSNHVAQRLYRKYGFRFTGVHHGYYRDGEDAWLMEVGVNLDAYHARLAEMRCFLEARLHFWQEDAGQSVGQNNGDTL
ncbi:MAG: ribosomal protein S18-alanine N-acetyltransferase [Chloroflexi bacterium]|nr:ribosomal protein S18-alanine N-acetyltransferase [Chloroflexota bacterium]